MAASAFQPQKLQKNALISSTKNSVKSAYIMASGHHVHTVEDGWGPLARIHVTYCAYSLRLKVLWTDRQAGLNLPFRCFDGWI